MAIGSPMTATIPDVGDAGTAYATEINAFLAEVEAALEAKVPFSALEGSTLDLNNVPVVDATYVHLVESAALPVASPIGRIQRYQNNLYWVTDEGVLRLTNGLAVDASSIGGIGGDYGGGNPALVSFHDGTSMYRFYDDSGTSTWAYLRSRGLDIADGAATTDVVRLRSPALAASYDFTFPTDLPGSNRSVLVISSAGQVEDNDATNTITNDIHLGGATKIRHGSRELVNVAYPHLASAPAAITYYGNGFRTTTAQAVACHVNGLVVGQRITAIKITLTKVDTASTSLEFHGGSFGGDATLATGASTTSGNVTVTLTLGSPETVVTGTSYWVEIITAANNDDVWTIGAVYDVVA